MWRSGRWEQNIEGHVSRQLLSVLAYCGRMMLGHFESLRVWFAWITFAIKRLVRKPAKTTQSSRPSSTANAELQLKNLLAGSQPTFKHKPSVDIGIIGIEPFSTAVSLKSSVDVCRRTAIYKRKCGTYWISRLPWFVKKRVREICIKRDRERLVPVRKRLW